MKKIWCFLINPDRPKILTVMGFVFLIFALLNVVNLIVVAIKPDHYVRALAWLKAFIQFAMIYFLLSGKNWARLLVAFSSALGALMILATFFNGGYSFLGLFWLIYIVAVFYILMFKKDVVKYFTRNRTNHSSKSAYTAPGD